MKYLKTQQIFEKELAYLTQPVEIRFDVQTTRHSADQKYRYGVDNVISDKRVVDIIESSIEQLTIDLMHDKLNVEERFIIKEEDIHIVAVLKSGEEYFTMVIITVDRRDDFKIAKGQYVLDVQAGTSYKS